MSIEELENTNTIPVNPPTMNNKIKLNDHKTEIFKFNFDKYFIIPCWKSNNYYCRSEIIPRVSTCKPTQ